MQQLDNIQTSADYTLTDSLTDPLANVLELVVTVADVYARFRPYDADRHNELPWGEEQRIVSPTRLLLSNVSGVELRSAAAGTPATCTATLYQPSDPQPHAASAGATVTTLSNNIGVQHNEVLVGQEGILDFDDGGNVEWTISDDAADGRIKIAADVPSPHALASGSRPASVPTSGTTFATGADLLSSALSFVADGSSSYLVEFFAPGWSAAAAGASLHLNLDGADAGTLAALAIASGQSVPLRAATVITPATGLRTVNARLVTGSGTATVAAGAGGAGTNLPIFGSVRLY